MRNDERRKEDEANRRVVTTRKGLLQAIVELADGSLKRLKPFPRGTSWEYAKEKALEDGSEGADTAGASGAIGVLEEERQRRPRGVESRPQQGYIREADDIDLGDDEKPFPPLPNGLLGGVDPVVAPSMLIDSEVSDIASEKIASPTGHPV